MFRHLVLVTVFVATLAGSAFGMPNYKMVVRDAATGLSFGEVGPYGGTFTLEIFIDNQGDTSGGLAIGGCQARLMCDRPGVFFEPAVSSGTSIQNYALPWTQDATSTALWAGWFEADPDDPATPRINWDTGEM